MILYHGSTEIVEKPKIIAENKFLDFGYGFYTTTSKEQALRWAKIKSKRIRSAESYLNIYEMDDSILSNPLFSVLSFDNPSREWVEFVIKNRRGNAIHSRPLITYFSR
jgi:hypothetical protein